jgi:hypothetical protein
MNRLTRIEAAAFVFLAAAGVALRMYFEAIPNFAPVAALALFAGYFFASRWTAAALPLAVMVITDWFIGGYHAMMMVVVYGALAAPVLAGPLLRRWFSLPGREGGSARKAAASTAALVGCSLAASVMFFVVTNFAHWAIYDMYEKSAAGLLNCYAAALHFFRYTLAGDLSFACVLFGGYAVAKSLAAAPSTQTTALADARRG